MTDRSSAGQAGQGPGVSDELQTLPYSNNMKSTKGAARYNR